MLLGSISGAGADAHGSDGGAGGAGGAELLSGIKLGALGCLRDAADQQRLSRAVVMQARTVHTGTHPRVSQEPPASCPCCRCSGTCWLHASSLGNYLLLEQAAGEFVRDVIA